VTKEEMDLIFLLRIINAEPEENIKYSDLKLRFGDLFRRFRIEYLTTIAQNRNLITIIQAGEKNIKSELIILTEEGKKHISLVK